MLRNETIKKKEGSRVLLYYVNNVSDENVLQEEKTNIQSKNEKQL
jgi:hypothetical protein